MSCSTTDWKGFVLGEIPETERGEAEAHLAGCEACREEVERLRVTEAALLAVADEEIPQRIAFVSDKVFEPRWWQRIWSSGPALGFAGATVLAAAILVHALVPARVEPPAIDSAALESMVEQEVASRVEAAVTEAVSAVEVRQAQETERLLSKVQADFDMERSAYLLAVEEAFNAIKKRENVLMVASMRQERGLE